MFVFDMHASHCYNQVITICEVVHILIIWLKKSLAVALEVIVALKWISEHIFQFSLPDKLILGMFQTWKLWNYGHESTIRPFQIFTVIMFFIPGIIAVLLRYEQYLLVNAGKLWCVHLCFSVRNTQTRLLWEHIASENMLTCEAVGLRKCFTIPLLN